MNYGYQLDLSYASGNDFRLASCRRVLKQVLCITARWIVMCNTWALLIRAGNAHHMVNAWTEGVWFVMHLSK